VEKIRQNTVEYSNILLDTVWGERKEEEKGTKEKMRQNMVEYAYIHTYMYIYIYVYIYI